MISLRSAMRTAMENDHEFRGDFQMEPFEDISGEDPMDKFEFELGPVAEAVAMESQRVFSRRHRVSAESARISMEEAGIGFWALMAAAVAAAIVALFKMISWFTGDSVGGGGGGGGGGGSGGGAVKKMSEKAKVAGEAATVSRDHLKTVLSYAR